MEHVETHGADHVGEALPLTGDVGHHELELGSGYPGVRSLGLKLA